MEGGRLWSRPVTCYVVQCALACDTCCMRALSFRVTSNSCSSLRNHWPMLVPHNCGLAAPLMNSCSTFPVVRRNTRKQMAPFKTSSILNPNFLPYDLSSMRLLLFLPHSLLCTRTQKNISSPLHHTNQQHTDMKTICKRLAHQLQLALSLRLFDLCARKLQNSLETCRKILESAPETCRWNDHFTIDYSVISIRMDNCKPRNNSCPTPQLAVSIATHMRKCKRFREC